MELHEAQNKYRRRYRNCSYCKFWNVESKIDLGIYYEECLVKDKKIKRPRLKALFCKYYRIK